MPFYEYECSACKFYVEALQKISDPPMKKCPSCKKQTLTKLVSAPAFRLAGGGWYETDFKSDKENKRNLVGEEKDTTPSESKPDATDAKKTEAKVPEGKPEKPAEKASSSASKKSAVKAKPKASRPKPKAPAKKK
jgi:putative FmdB family regulatory protein